MHVLMAWYNYVYKPETANGSLLVLDEHNENSPECPNLVMKVIKTALLVVAFISQITVYASYAPKIERKACEISPQKCVEWYAQEYNVPLERLNYIVEHESQWNEKAVGDMNLTCARTGMPVRARGYLQITECFYPEIGDECAFDLQCSLDNMIKLIRNDETCRSQWSTCRKFLSN